MSFFKKKKKLLIFWLSQVLGAACSFLWLWLVGSRAHGLSCCMACGILVPQPGIRLSYPALEGGFLTAGPPGKSPVHIFKGPTGCCLSVQTVSGGGGAVECGDQTRGFGRSPGERRVAGTRAVTVEAKVGDPDTFGAGAPGAFSGLAVGSENVRATPEFMGEGSSRCLEMI